MARCYIHDEMLLLLHLWLDVVIKFTIHGGSVYIRKKVNILNYQHKIFC